MTRELKKIEDLGEPDLVYSPTRLIPVSEWVWALWKVEFWVNEYDAQHHDGPLGTVYVVSASENHVKGEIEDCWPHNAGWATWEVLEDNVARPRTIGSIYGMPLSEGGLVAGMRMAHERRLV